MALLGKRIKLVNGKLVRCVALVEARWQRADGTWSKKKWYKCIVHKTSTNVDGEVIYDVEFVQDGSTAKIPCEHFQWSGTVLSTQVDWSQGPGSQAPYQQQRQQQE